MLNNLAVNEPSVMDCPTTSNEVSMRAVYLCVVLPKETSLDGHWRGRARVSLVHVCFTNISSGSCNNVACCYLLSFCAHSQDVVRFTAKICKDRGSLGISIMVRPPSVLEMLFVE